MLKFVKVRCEKRQGYIRFEAAGTESVSFEVVRRAIRRHSSEVQTLKR